MQHGRRKYRKHVRQFLTNMNDRKYTWYAFIFQTLNFSQRTVPHSWLFTGFVSRVTRRLPLEGQELLTHPEYLSSPPVFSGVRVTRSLLFCVMFCWLLFVLFIFTIVLSVLRFTDSYYPFGIFKLFFQQYWLPTGDLFIYPFFISFASRIGSECFPLIAFFYNSVILLYQLTWYYFFLWLSAEWHHIRDVILQKKYLSKFWYSGYSIIQFIL
jgi:hypothetical protein